MNFMHVTTVFLPFLRASRPTVPSSANTHADLGIKALPIFKDGDGKPVDAIAGLPNGVCIL